MPAALDETTSFSYAHGPTQRLVVEMAPEGPIARNALPGGEVWDSRDDHFRDEAELWRRNQNRPVPFATSDVVGAAESRTIYESP
jgi:penicillin amidase